MYVCELYIIVFVVGSTIIDDYNINKNKNIYIGNV